MKRVALLVVLAIAQDALAQSDYHPPPVPDLWIAGNDASSELEACSKQAGSLIGDVMVDTTWKASASKSLGAKGPAIAACTRDALKKHYKPGSRRGGAPESYTLRIGTPTQVLPPIAKFMPVWRAAIAPHATKAERDAFAKLLPADYRISKQCIVTDRPYARDLEEAWLGGITVITTWSYLLDELTGYMTRTASWDGTGLVTLSMKGLCAETFDPVAVRAVFDKEGTCWAGTPADILLAPRIEFPKASYTQVATQKGRTCAVTTTGTVTCCGRTDATLGTAPVTPQRQVALGDDFTCGLDAAGSATCWGSVTTAPTGAFTKLAAGHYRVCGLRRDDSVECWPNAPSPKGKFIDIALDGGACGVHTDGTIECWERALTSVRPGRWQTLAIGGEGDATTVCGLRRDQSVGCTLAKPADDGRPMATPVPQRWMQIAVAKAFGACGIQLDGTIACSDLQPAWLKPRGTPPPPGKFTQIAADESQFCALASAGTISCWGAPWPTRPPSSSAPLATTGLHGTIVDEAGAPIAGATVSIEEKRSVPPTVSTSAADGTWISATNQRTLWAKITAPGREVVDLYGEQSQFARPVVLRPASTVTVEASCDRRPCSAMVEVGHYLFNPKLEHVGPGNYRWLVWSEHGTERERLAIVDVEMPFAARPQLVRAALKRTGTGLAIRGSVWTMTPKSPEGLRVELTCANETYRRVNTDKLGNFELRNVPHLPCTLQVSGLDAYSNEVKINSYADQKVEFR